MRLTVIGSSPAWPNPGSAHSGYLVEDGGALLLDCGPGVLARLRERRTHVDAIAITHFHLDHWGDLVPWAWLVIYGPEDERRRRDLWLPPGGVRELERFASAWGNERMFERAFDQREYEPGKTFSAAGLEVEAHRLSHYDLDAHGFRVTSRGRTLAYSGDSGPCEELAALARGADLFVCEATLARGEDEGRERGHLSVEEALAAAEGRILVTHRPVELASPDHVPIAYDGLVVDV